MMSTHDWSTILSSTPDGIAIRIKVVPGASRSKIVSVLGDRLKVAVAAPPEGGKANKAVCELFAKLLGMAKREVMILTGPTQPLKTVEVLGISLCAATEVIESQLG